MDRGSFAVVGRLFIAAMSSPQRDPVMSRAYAE